MGKRALLIYVFLASVVAGGQLPAQELSRGYLTPAVALHIEAWLPPSPAEDSMANAADVEAYLRTRAQIGTARAEEARADDVGKAIEVAPRFAYVMGVTFDGRSAPHY